MIRWWQLQWGSLLLAGHLVAQPYLATETVFARPVTEPGGFSGAIITAPVLPRATVLRDAFERVPGLLLQESFGGIEPPRLSVRGSGVQSAPVSRGVGLHLDGFPLNFADGSFNTALIEVAWIEGVQLTPGPAAGASNMGGELSLWSDLLESEQGGELRVRFGDDNTAAMAVWQRWSFQQNFAATGFSVNRTDGWRDNSKQRRESVIAFFRFPLDPERGREIQTHLLAARPRFEVPGPLTLVDAIERPDSNSAPVLRDRPYRESKYIRLGSRFGVRSDQGFFSMALAGVLYEDEFRQLLPNGISDTSAHEASFSIDFQKDWQDQLDQQLDGRILFQTASRDLTRNRNIAGSPGPRIGDNRLRPDSLTVSLDHSLRPSTQWRLELGSSLFYARRQIIENFNISDSRPSTALDLEDTQIAPRAALSWFPTDRVRVSLALSRTYEAPTFDDLIFTVGPPVARDLGSAPLNWQRADQIQLLLQIKGEHWNARLALYEARWKGEFLRLLDQDGSPRGTANAEDTARTGLEFSGDWSFYELGPVRFRGWATAQWISHRFSDDPIFQNNRIAGVAPFSGVLGLETLSSTGWFLAPSVRGQSGRLFVDHANTLSSSGYAVWTLDAGRRHPSGWAAHIRVENLFDKRYIASPAGVLDRAGPPELTTVFLPGVGRRWEIGLNYIW